jgi:3-dehydroquinate synthetase
MSKSLNFISIPKVNPSKKFDILTQIFSSLPLDELDNGITLVVVGEEWFINDVCFACQLLNPSIHLVSVPISLWGMIEMGVNDVVFLDFDHHTSTLKMSYCPQMVLLDVKFLNTKNQDDRLLSNAVILRNLLIAPSGIFHLFQSNISGVISDNASVNIQIVEELISSRLIFFQDEYARKCLKDFGVRFLDHYCAKSKDWPSKRKFVLLVLEEICWRWKMSKEMNICKPEEADSIFSLLGEICLKYEVSSKEWDETKIKMTQLISAKMLQHIFLPETVGKVKLIDSIELKLAQKCLKNC